MHRFVASAVAVAAIVQSSLAQARFIPLGELPGGAGYSQGVDISADGEVVTGSSGSYLSYWGEAFRWNEPEGMRGLGLLPDSSQSYGHAISPDGRAIVGGVVRDGTYEAFRWSSERGMEGLGELPGGEFYSEAHGVSRSGEVIVGSSKSGEAEPGQHEAFIWSESGGMRGLGFLPGAEYRSSSAGDVSADGRVVIGRGAWDTRSGEAFRWTEETGMVALGELSGGRHSSHAYAISDNGRWIVGESSGEDSSGSELNEAVLWHPDGTLERLGQLGDSGPRYSRAYGVSDNGQVVVGVATNIYDEHSDQAMIWTPKWGMRRLQEVLLTEYALDIDAMGYRLGAAAAVTADGSSIAGWALNQSTFLAEAFVVHLPIPAPSTLVLLAPVACMFSRRRR